MKNHLVKNSQICRFKNLIDLCGYLEPLPMNPNNVKGPGINLAKGKRIYRKFCTKCHGKFGDGDASKLVPRIRGQHYEYMIRQFYSLRAGKRAEMDQELFLLLQKLKGKNLYSGKGAIIKILN